MEEFGNASQPDPVQLSASGAGRSFYSISQAAALLGVSRVSIWRWIRDGRLPVARLGHRTARIARDDLERVLIQHTPAGTRSVAPLHPGSGPSIVDGAAPERAPTAAWWTARPSEHVVQFYDTDAFLLDAVGTFIGAALCTDDAAIVVATRAHREALEQRLQEFGLDVAGARAQGLYVALDAADTLSRFMVDGAPDPDRFAEIIGGLIARAAEGGRGVRVFGEMVALLAEEGNHAAVRRLEELWNDLQETHPFALFCGYPLEYLDGVALAAFAGDICAAHTRVVPAESYTALNDPDDRLRAVAMLQQKARALEGEIEERRRAERRLAVQYAVTRILAESDTLSQAAMPILQSLCDSLGWEAAAIWSADPQVSALHCDEFWHVAAVDVAEFEATSREQSFSRGVGLPGRVWASGTPVWIPDVLADDNFPRAPHAAKSGLHGAFGFPIGAGDEVFGAMEFFSREIQQPDDDLLEMMAGVGGQIGQFIERRRAEEERRRLLAAEQQARSAAEAALRRLRAVQAITDAALAHLSTHDLLQELLARITEIFDVDNTAILIPTDDGRQLELHMARGPEEQIAGQVRVPVGKGIAGTIAGTRRPLVVDDLRTVEVANPFLRQTIRSLMGVPLVVEDRLVGVLHAGTAAPRHFTEDDLLLLRLIGDRIGLALEHARLFEEEEQLRAEAVGRAAELEAIFEAMTDGVFVFGPAGEVWRCNSMARELLGMDAPPAVVAQPLEARGQRGEVWDAHGRPLPPAQWPLFRVLKGEVLTGENVEDHVIRLRDGVAREFSVSGAPIRDPKGAITGAVCVIRDVTERRRLEARIVAERNRLQQVLDVLPEGIVIADANPPAVVAMNRAAAEYLGIDLVGQPVPIPPPGADGAFEARRLDGTPFPVEELPLERALLRGEMVRGEQFQIRDARSGREISVLANSAPLRDAEGSVDGAVEVFQDISALKDMERQREEFLASVSHDLKNPLTSILGMSQLLQVRARRMAEADQARMGEGLGAIVETARRMAAQIDELLDVTRAQMGRPRPLELAPTDVATLVVQLIDEYQRTTERHRLRVQGATGTLVGLVDATRLQRALANLLANAIKYSPQGGDILITLACVEDHEGPRLTISVADQGIGIPHAEVDRVFEGYYRASNVAGQVTGTGLGLTGVRQIAEQHGGTVSIASTEGVGTTVTITLPLRRPPVEASA